MNDDIFETRLRDTLTAVAATTEVKDRWNEIAAVPTPARREQRPLLIAAAAFVVVLVTVGSFALVATLAGRGRDVVSPPVDITGTPSAELRYPVPGYIPPGASDVWAQIPVADSVGHTVVAAVVGRRTSLDGEGGPTDIDQITAVHLRERTPGEEAPEGEVIRVGDREVIRLPEGALSGSVSLTWTEGDVTAVVYVSDGDVDRALDVIEGVSWSGDDLTVPGVVEVAPPSGLDLIAEPTVQNYQPGPMVTMQWDDPVSPVTTDTVPGLEPLVSTLQIDISVSEESPEMLLTAHPVAQSFELRGRPAYMVWRREYSGVIWEEVPGVTVTVSGWNADPTAIIQIAEGLEFTDEETWWDMFGLDGEPGVPPTMVDTTSANVGG